MTKEHAELLTDEALLNLFADNYGMAIFCEGYSNLLEEVKVYKEEILRRMKKN